MQNSSQYPLVTFLSPCYNHEKYVIQSLESIKAQTYLNIHHIIIDDASTDNSVSIIEKWINDNSYNCTFIKHTTNKGIGFTLNESLELMKGEYWSPCSTDDYVHPTRTEKFIKFFQENPKAMMVASDMKMIDDAGNEMAEEENASFLQKRVRRHPTFILEEFGTYESLLFDNYMPGSLMVKKEAFDALGNFKHLIIEDWEMWLRISARYKIGFINEPLAYYRSHPFNAMKKHATSRLRRAMFETFFYQKKYCYTNNKMQLFNRAYLHHFNNYYNPVKHPSTSFIFHRINMMVYFKALAHKIRKLIKSRRGLQNS